MRKMVGFGAVDVVTHPHAAAKFQEDYNFKVDGVPTIVVFKPKADGSRPERIIYKYEPHIPAPHNTTLHSTPFTRPHWSSM